MPPLHDSDMIQVASKTCSGTHTLNIVALVTLNALSWDNDLKGMGEAYCCYVQIYCPMVVLQSIGTTEYSIHSSVETLNRCEL